MAIPQGGLWRYQQEGVIFSAMQEHVKAEQGELEESAGIIPSLQLHLIVLACQDPGPEIATRLVLPALQERLEANASQFEAAKAASGVAESGKLKVSACRTAASRLKSSRF